MPRAESDAHVRLKQLALDWARAAGFVRVGVEVRVPRSGFRADVVAMAEGGPTGDGETAVFECKQSRADFLKDAHAEMFVRRRVAELLARQRALEELLAVHRPEWRRGEAFWPEFDTWDIEGVEHRTYRCVVAELATLRRRGREGTKFARMTRYGCADRLFLVLEPDLAAEAELPEGWGVLVREDDRLRLLRPALALAVTPGQRAALVRNLRRTEQRRGGGAGADEVPLLQLALSA